MLWHSWHTFIIVPLEGDLWAFIFCFCCCRSSPSTYRSTAELWANSKSVSFWHHWRCFKKEANSCRTYSLPLKWSVAAIERKMDGDNKALAGEPWQLLLPTLMRSVASVCVHQDRYSPQIPIHLTTRKSPKSLLCTLLQFVVYCNIVQLQVGFSMVHRGYFLFNLSFNHTDASLFWCSFLSLFS